MTPQVCRGPKSHGVSRRNSAQTKPGADRLTLRDCYVVYTSSKRRAGYFDLLTIWLAIFFFLPSPSGPDRAMMGWACILLQTPRWICMALVLGICVARGAFTWPESRAAQYAIVFLAHAALGAGAICAALGGLGMTSGIPGRLARLLQLGTVLVPSIEIAFAAWFLNLRLRKGLEAVALRHTINTWLVAFGATVGVFLLSGAAAWMLSAADKAKRRVDHRTAMTAKREWAAMGQKN
jgi:hypothetical protein